MGAPVEVWPDNWQSFEVFESMGTQWRTAFGGAVGLDYNVLYHKLDRLRLDDDDYRVLEDDIRVMESAVLDYWAEQRKQQHE